MWSRNSHGIIHPPFKDPEARRSDMEKLTRRQLASAAFGTSAGAAPPPSRSVTGTTRPRSARKFPNVLLRTHEDRPVWFYDDLIKGKTVLITFMYATCEGVCPGTAANLRKVQQRMGARAGRDVFLYSITIKPTEDTPQALKRYAEMHGAGPGWLFLTGAADDIELLRRTLGFVDPDPVAARDASSHIGVVLYGNEPLDRWAACPALSNADLIYESVLWLEGRMPGLESQAPRGAERVHDGNLGKEASR
jgi:protein SCO1